MNHPVNMTRIDLNTLVRYRENRNEIARRFEFVISPFEWYFALVIILGARVLNVGCGSGRDVTL
jgi:hypothetical protein